LTRKTTIIYSASNVISVSKLVEKRTSRYLIGSVSANFAYALFLYADPNPNMGPDSFPENQNCAFYFFSQLIYFYFDRCDIHVDGN